MSRMGRPLSPSLQSQVAGFRDVSATGEEDDIWTKLRPGTSPAAPTSPGSESLRTARPWTVSLASVKSFTSGSLAGDSWSELLSKGLEDGPGRPAWLHSRGAEPLNPRAEILAQSLVSKVKESCEEYRVRKREDDLRAFHGIWSNMSFRRPRGMDILSDRARAARKPLEPLADGFVQPGPTGQTAFEIAKQTSVLQTLDSQHFTLIDRLIEADAMHFVSVMGGQVLFRETDPVENAYIVLTGSVQQYSRDHGFLRSMGWHPHEQIDEEDARPKSTKSEGAPEDLLAEELDPKAFPTLVEFCRKGGQPDDDRQRRYRTLEGHSTFTQEASYGNLYNTATAGCLVGEAALKSEKQWRSTAVCFKDCEFLVIDGTIFQNVLKSVRETHRFFDLYLPGIKANPKAKARPHPIEYWKREFLPVGETVVEEGMEPLEPFVFMVQRGKLELKRYRRSGANPAYVLATQPLRGRSNRMVTKDVPSVVPEVARSFVEDLDEDGLPRLGLPPPLKGSVREKMEEAYLADPKSYVPADVPKSKEAAKIHHHKVLLKERLESRSEQRAERLREKSLREERHAREAFEEDLRRMNPRQPTEQLDEIRALIRYVQSISAARPGSPDYIGSDLWSDRDGRDWMSTDVNTGPFTRPPSSHVIREPDTRHWDETQETCAVLKPGDLYCSLNFFPLWGVSEPFSVVSASPDCCVHFVRGVQEAKAIPKHILKEIRLEMGRSLQKKLGTLISGSKGPGSVPAPAQKVATAPESEAPTFFPGAGPPPPDSVQPDLGPLGGEGPDEGPLGEASVSLSRSLKRDDRLQVSEPLLRPRSAASSGDGLLRSGTATSLGSGLGGLIGSTSMGAFAAQGGARGQLGQRAARTKPYRPSFLRWLVYGKVPPKPKQERKSLLRCCWRS